MQNAHRLANQKVFSGVTIASVAPRENSDYVDVTFSNGKVLQGERPYSTLPLYEYTVEYSDNTYDNGTIISATPRKLPMTLSRLAMLMPSCRVEFDLEDLVYCDPSLFDPRSDASDQSENLRKNWPNLVERLEQSLEGVLYFRFEDVSLLPLLYEVRLLRTLSPRVLLKTAEMARKTPSLLAFKVTLPCPDLPEINEEDFNALVRITGHSFSIGEKAGIMLYNKWLKNDITQWGNLTSMLNQASKYCPAFSEEGVQYLKENKIIDIVQNKYAVLTEVLQWEESIRVSCETLKTRFTETEGFVPLRDHVTQPYNKVDMLKTLSPEQDHGLNNVILKNPVSILSGMAGTGKCLAPETPVLMFDGTIKMAKDIKQGDFLMGDDSKPRTVLNTCSGRDQMYKIIPSKGRSFVCNEPHILTLKGIEPYIQTVEGRRLGFRVQFTQNGELKTRSFETEKEAQAFKEKLNEDVFDIPLNEYLQKSSTFKRYTYLFHTGVEFPEIGLDMDPYIIGFWLGDGRSDGPSLTIGDLELVSHFDKKLDEYGLELRPIPSDPISYHVVGKGENYRQHGGNALINALRDFNLLKNKHIPMAYKKNSREARLALLAGLIDSDGYQAGNYYEIIQKNKVLAEDIEYVAFSLGFMVTVTESQKSWTYNGEKKHKIYYRINIFGDGLDEIPVALERKKCTPRAQKKRALCQSFKVELLGEGTYNGFELDGNGRFLLGDFLVTHNTTVLAHLVNKFGPKAVLGCAPTNRATRVLTKKVVYSKTMHKLLAELVSEETDIELDQVRILVIDEASMIPERLMAYFLEIAVKKCPNLQRLILVGDVAQLESVEAGTVLQDFVDSFEEACVFLSRSHRVTPESILIHENACKVRNKRTDITEDPNSFIFTPFTRVLYNDLEATIKAHPDMTPWNSHFISPYREEAKTIGGLAKQFMTGKISSPGVFHKGDKILSTKNYHGLNVINGDFFKLCDILVMHEENIKKEVAVALNAGTVSGTGTTKIERVKCTIESTNYRLERGEWFRFMVVPASFTNEESREMDATEPFAVDVGVGRNRIPLNTFTLGYCTTNHQFQGCEADYVVFDLRKVTYFVNWKQVYTAITRAKRKVIILGNKENFDAAVTQKVIPRRSMLFENLGGENEFLKTLPPVEESENERLKRLMREMSVDDDTSAPDGGIKRGIEARATDSNKRGRY